MTRTLLLLVLVMAATASSAAAQASATQLTAAEKNGKTVFDKWCTPCHGPVAPARGGFGTGALPGTAALAVKYQNRVPPVLEQRTNLAPGQIRTVVRNGLFGMPITRKTEVSDKELDDIVAYLTRKR